MSNASSLIPVYALAFLSCLVAGTAAARPRHDAPVTLRIHVSEPGSSVAVETADKTSGPKGRLVLHCASVCDEQLLRASYKLTISRGGATPEYDSQVIHLKRSMQFTTLPPNSGLYALGVTLLIGGGVVAVSGFCALLPALSSALGHGGRPRPTALEMYGWIALASGGALALLGLPFYWFNRLAFDADKLEPRALSLRMQLVPTSSGLAGTLTGRF